MPDRAWQWVADTALALQLGAEVEEVGAITLRAVVAHVAELAVLWIAPPSDDVRAHDAPVPGVLRLAHARPDVWARLGPDASGALAGRVVLDLPPSHPASHALRGAAGRFLTVTEFGGRAVPRADDAVGSADVELRTLVRELGSATAVLVPLTWRGVTLGAMLLATTAAAARRLAPADVARAGTLAMHVGAALARAQATAAQQRAAAEQSTELAVMAHDAKHALALARAVLEVIAREAAVPSGAPHADRVEPRLAGARRVVERLSAVVDDTLRRAPARPAPPAGAACSRPVPLAAAAAVQTDP